MAIHYFHCTDGTDLILDRSGRETVAHSDIFARAHSVAREVMDSLPAYDEWENWAVHVYDEGGQIEIVPFRESRPDSALRAA